MKLEEKQRKNRKILSNIHLYMPNSTLQVVLKHKSVVALWLKLEQPCITKSLTSKLYMKQWLYSLHMYEVMSLEDNLIAFKGIVSDLEVLEVNYEEKDLGLFLLCSLPSSYFRNTILYSRDILTLDEVCDALFSKKKTNQLVVRSKTQVEGLTIYGRSQEQNSKSEPRDKSKSSNKCNIKRRGTSNLNVISRE